MKSTIAILGAGPSGLTLARLLEVKHFDYVVFERDAAPSDIGQGGTLDVHTNSGQEVLKQCGLFDKFKSIARYDAQETRMVDKDGNAIWIKKDEGQEDRPEIDRKDLRRLLLDSVPAEKIRWGARVEDVQRENDGSMTVRLADGKEETGFQLVVGADGAWSRARSLITPTKPVYSGFCYLQTSISRCNPIYSRVCEQAGPGSMMAMTGGKGITAQRLADGSYMIYVQLMLPEHWAKKNEDVFHSSAFRKQLVEEEFPDWPAEMTDLISQADNFSYAWPLYALPLDSLPWEHVPGVTLIGDAAHLGVPNGEGVNCAMYDALQLVEEMGAGESGNLEDAVKHYEEKMFPRAIEHIESGHQMNKVFFAPDAPKSIKEWIAQMVQAAEEAGQDKK